MSRIRFILDPWIRFRWLRIRILGNFNSVNLGFPYEMFCNVFFHINYIYYKIQNVTKKTFRRICRKDQPITRTNFFHGFGKFLALPGSGSVSSETDPDPAKWYGSGHWLEMRFFRNGYKRLLSNTWNTNDQEYLPSIWTRNEVLSSKQCSKKI